MELAAHEGEAMQTCHKAQQAQYKSLTAYLHATQCVPLLAMPVMY